MEPTQPNLAIPWRQKLSVLVVFTLLGILVYGHTLHAPFFYDDIDAIETNVHVRLTELSLTPLLDAAFKSPSKFRPLSNITYALNYYFHGFNLPGYHVVNIAIHILTAMALFFLFQKTLGLLPHPKFQNDRLRPWLPFVAALLWLIHPLHTQSVTYIVQRMTSMASLFYVLALLMYIHLRLAETRGRKIIDGFGVIGFAFLAICSKENALTLPLIILAFELFFFQNLRKSVMQPFLIGGGGVVILLFLSIFLFMGTDPLDQILKGCADRNFTLNQRLLTEFRVVIYYLFLIVWPRPSALHLVHDFPLSNGLLEPVTTLFSILALTALAVWSVYAARKERLLSFGMVWFLGNLVIESTIIPLDIIYEHRTYLPSMMLFLAMVHLIHRKIPSIWIKGSVFISLSIILAAWTYERNLAWQDKVTFWSDCVSKSPGKALNHVNLGIALWKAGKPEEAVTHYRQAIAINPNYHTAHNNLGIVLWEMGKYEEALKHYSEGLRLRPGYAPGHYYIGATQISLNNMDAAIEQLNEAIRIDPKYAKAHNKLGLAYRFKGRLAQALHHFKQALTIRPDFPEAHFNLANLLAQTQDLKGAIKQYQAAIKGAPDYAEAHFNLGNIYNRQKDYAQAIKHYAQAIALKPDYVEAHNNIGIAYALLGDSDKALPHFKKALAINPNYQEARKNMNLMMQNAN